VETGAESRTLTGHSYWVMAVAFSPDGAQVVTGSADNPAFVWDVETGEKASEFLGHANGITGALWLDETRVLTASLDGTAQVWDAATGTVAQRYGDDNLSSIRSITLGRIDGRLALARLTGTVDMWSSGGELLDDLTGHSGAVNGLAFNADGTALAAGNGNVISPDSTIRVWDVASGTVAETLISQDGNINSVAFNPAGTALVAGTEFGVVQVWDLTSDQALQRIPAHINDVLSVAFSPDGTQVVSGGADAKVHLWDAATGEAIGEGVKTEQSFTVAEGMVVASTGFEDLVKLPDLQSELAASLVCSPGSGISSMALTPDRTTMASAIWDKSIRLFDVATVTERVSLLGHTDSILIVAFNADGSLLASAGVDKTVRLWDVATGRPLAVMQGHLGWVNTLAFSPDGRTLASGADDGTVRLWDVGSILPE